ncbi:MAG: hypothetical protein ACRD29_15135 [Acidimicrobiales bacterium]
MATAWVVTVPSVKVDLDAAGRGEITFTVANPGPVQDRAVFDLVLEGADRSWFAVDEPQRTVQPGMSVAYLVKVAVPAGTPAGSFAVQGRVYSADTAPEESSALSNRVAIDVEPTAAPERAKPWWLIPVGVAVVLVVGVAAYLVLKDDEEDDTAAVDPPVGLEVGPGGGSGEVSVTWDAMPDPPIATFAVQRQCPGEDFEDIVSVPNLDDPTQPAGRRAYLDFPACPDGEGCYRVVAVARDESASEPSDTECGSPVGG